MTDKRDGPFRSKCVTHLALYEKRVDGKRVVSKPEQSIFWTFSICTACARYFDREHGRDSKTGRVNLPEWADFLVREDRKEKREIERQSGVHRELPPEEHWPFEEDDEGGQLPQDETITKHVRDAWEEPSRLALGDVTIHLAFDDPAEAMEHFEEDGEALFKIIGTAQLIGATELELRSALARIEHRRERGFYKAYVARYNGEAEALGREPDMTVEDLQEAAKRWYRKVKEYFGDNPKVALSGLLEAILEKTQEDFDREVGEPPTKQIQAINEALVKEIRAKTP